MRTPQTGDRKRPPPIPSPLDLYDALDGPARPVRRRGRIRPRRLRAVLVALIAVAFLAGIALDAAVLHFGDHGRSPNVVIGQQVIREAPSPQRTVPKPPPSSAPSLAWSGPVLVDLSGSLRSVSCTSDSFCAAVDGHGLALLYTGGRWSSAEDVDGSNQINSISCSGETWCAAVDQAGNALYYDGASWTVPQRIDPTEFPELTSVSCSSPTFCAAVDGGGNGLIFNGHKWSAPQQVDPPGWSVVSKVSRDVPSVSCPEDGSCVGVDPENNAFFYEGGAWQLATAINPSSGGAALKSPNAVSCASTTFCVATDNLGRVEAYDGTQWSVPVTVDDAEYVSTISCPSASFCAGVDSLLPAGFNNDSSNGSGQILIYNGVTWSVPHPIDDVGLISSISCPSPSFCVAVDGSGQVVTGRPPAGTRTP